MPPCSAFLRFFLSKSATPICCAQTFKTATVDNSLDPRWNETFTYDLPLAGASQTPYAELKCVFAVFDRDILSADDQLCTFTVRPFLRSNSPSAPHQLEWFRQVPLQEHFIQATSGEPRSFFLEPDPDSAVRADKDSGGEGAAGDDVRPRAPASPAQLSPDLIAVRFRRPRGRKNARQSCGR